jgi:hypothetical protein
MIKPKYPAYLHAIVAKATAVVSLFEKIQNFCEVVSRK